MPAPGGGASPGGPAASPMATPQDKKGVQTAAMVNLQIAQNMLEQALTAFEPSMPEYDAIIDCLKRLSKVAGKSQAGDLVPAQIMRLVGQMPQAGGGTDQQRMIRQQMMRPQGQPQPQPAGAAG